MGHGRCPCPPTSAANLTRWKPTSIKFLVKEDQEEESSRFNSWNSLALCLTSPSEHLQRVLPWLGKSGLIFAGALHLDLSLHPHVHNLFLDALFDAFLGLPVIPHYPHAFHHALDKILCGSVSIHYLGMVMVRPPVVCRRLARLIGAVVIPHILRYAAGYVTLLN